MNLYVYSDESGVFDKVHNDYFVFGGIVCIGNAEKEILSRKYSKAEKTLRMSKNVSSEYELKASQITNSEKGKLFRSLNQFYKFGVIINEKRILERIFQSKKDKQRYLDYAYKICVKRTFEQLIGMNIIKPDDIERLYFFVDEHTTATNGRYELEEALEQEFKLGTYNYDYVKYYEPIFKNMIDVKLEYCNSSSKLLVRAADIVANKIYYFSKTGKKNDLKGFSNLFIIELP